MLSGLDRLTIYAVMCFISFSALVLRPAESVESLMPVWGVVATVFGIWLEMHHWKESGLDTPEN